jgi:hypothetical protein
MKVIFLYSDGSSRQLSFPSRLSVKVKVNDKLFIEPILCYFEGKLTPEQEGSVTTCFQFTQWQYWCLRQTRSFTGKPE